MNHKDIFKIFDICNICIENKIRIHFYQCKHSICIFCIFNLIYHNYIICPICKAKENPYYSIFIYFTELFKNMNDFFKNASDFIQKMDTNMAFHNLFVFYVNNDYFTEIYELCIWTDEDDEYYPYS